MNGIMVSPSEVYGEVSITGAKNSVLKLLTASILTDSPIELSNYPKMMLDVTVLEQMLGLLGKKIRHKSGIAEICGSVDTTHLDWKGRSIRLTLLVLGCLLAKKGEGKVPLPAGCRLGERKYDIHMRLMEAMGAEVWTEDGFLCAQNKTGARLSAIDFTLPIRSTGATENAVLMAVLAEGMSTIRNPHLRPELIDLISLLRKMGAKITVNGQESIVVEGVESLDESGVSHSVIGDSVQAFTYLVMGATAGWELCIRNFPFEDLEVPLIFLRYSGLKYLRLGNNLTVRKCNVYPIEICASAYPGINTDLQPLFAVWASLAKGDSTIIDLCYGGNRYGYAGEFRKMGVKSEVQGNRIVIHGGNEIRGGEVTAIDLRAGAALLLLSLVADSPVRIKDFWMVERGYDDIANTLKSIGVCIKPC